MCTKFVNAFEMFPDDLAPPFEGVPGGAEEPQAARGVHPIEAHLPGAGRSKVKPLIRSG